MYNTLTASWYMLQLDGTDVDLEDSHCSRQQAANAVSIPLLLMPCPGNSSADQDHSLAHSNGCIHHWPEAMSLHQGSEAGSAQASAGSTEAVAQSPSQTMHPVGKRKALHGKHDPEGVMLSDSVGRRPRLAAQASVGEQELDVTSGELVMRYA